MNSRASIPEKSEETVFLSQYDIRDYERPSVTADIIIFSLRREKGSSYRNRDTQKLSVLLIRRGEHPYRNHWALPGGFLRKDETLEECAYREIQEETGLTPVALFPISIFSAPNRDPRGWILSGAFASIVMTEELQAGNDAADAQWFDISVRSEGKQLFLTLQNDEETISLKLKKGKTCFGVTDYQVSENSELAFDHAEILAKTISVLRKESQDFRLALDFLPETFTLSDFQTVQQVLSGVEYAPGNFRRMVMDLVEETEELADRAGHRPARLYKRKEEAL